MDISLTSCGVTLGLSVHLGPSEVFLSSRRVFWVVSGQAGLVLPFCHERSFLGETPGCLCTTCGGAMIVRVLEKVVVVSWNASASGFLFCLLVWVSLS